jgi:hypothetical protein
MDRVMAGVRGLGPKAAAHAERELRRIAAGCRWTGGVWEELNYLPWDAVEDTPRHVRLLSNCLIRAYALAKGVTR